MVSYSSLSYQDGLRNVTLSTTSHTNITNSSPPQDSAAVTAAIVLSVVGLVAVIVGVILLLILWSRRRKRKQRYKGIPPMQLPRKEGMLDEENEEIYQ
jgi:beta-lactamase regulating signal transducer with metallopeptidase domain